MANAAAIFILVIIFGGMIAFCIWAIKTENKEDEKKIIINYKDELGKLQIWLAQERVLKKNNQQTIKALKERQYLLEYECDKLKEKLEKMKTEKN